MAWNFGWFFNTTFQIIISDGAFGARLFLYFIRSYSAARVGAGIPRPTALIRDAGGEYPPLRARYWTNLTCFGLKASTYAQKEKNYAKSDSNFRLAGRGHYFRFHGHRHGAVGKNREDYR